MLLALYGAFGAIGSGKTFKATEQALFLSNEEKKNIVANYPLDLDSLWLFCIINKLDNIIDLLNQPGAIKFIDLSKDEFNRRLHKESKSREKFISNASLMFDVHDSVIIIDEAGIFLNSRNWQNNDNLSILQRLCQSRKRSNHAFVIAQFPNQIDAQLRELLQYYLICSATTRRASDGCLYMVLQNTKMFEAQAYQKWQNSKHTSNPIKTRMAYTMRTWSGPLMCNQIQLFSIYNSYDELDMGADANIENYENLGGGIFSSFPEKKYKKYSELSPKQKIYYSILRILAPKFPAPGYAKLLKFTEKLTYILYELYKLSNYANTLKILLALSFLLISSSLHASLFFVSLFYLVYELIKFIYYVKPTY